VNVDDYHFPGPVLRRLTAEQVWDSLLTATMPAADERKRARRYRERYESMKSRVEGLEAMKKQPQKILAAAKSIAEVEYAHERETSSLRKRLAEAREAGEDALAGKLNQEMREARKAKDEEVKTLREAFETTVLAVSSESGGSPTMMQNRMRMDRMNGGSARRTLDDRPDPRWKGFDEKYLRASELRSPMPADHFLRQFGQSDRETIDAAEHEASVSQVLNLLNGNVFDRLTSSKSVLMRGVDQLYGDEEKQDFIFVSLLTRLPSEDERALLNRQFAAAEDDEEACRSIIWALLNTNELLFIQ
jgi:hypothetical protein